MMSRWLFPRLPGVVGTAVWENLKDMNTAVLSQQVSYSHELASFAQTGGSRVDENHLKTIRDNIHQIACQYGFPDSYDRQSRADFDTDCAVWLYGNCEMRIGEALRKDVWTFLALILMPDICRWRFPTGGRDRFLGGIRNVFQRLWLRAFLLHDDSGDGVSRQLLSQLSEDAFVAVTERPGLSSNPRVARKIAEAWSKVSETIGSGKMEPVHRDAMKRLRQMAPVICLDGLDEQSLLDTILSVYQASSGDFSEKKCGVCSGTGLVGESVCSVCEGSGKVYMSMAGGENIQRCPHCKGDGLWRGKVCDLCGGYGEITVD
jgi:hypothetical protein